MRVRTRFISPDHDTRNAICNSFVSAYARTRAFPFHVHQMDIKSGSGDAVGQEMEKERWSF